MAMSIQAKRIGANQAPTQYDARQLKRMLRLEAEYRETHQAGEQPKEFVDPLTGRTVPLKFHVSGEREGQPVQWTDLYRKFQRSGEAHYRLREEFVESLRLVANSEYDTAEKFVDAVLGR